ncbi:MAG TPA: hypothetical protein VM223_23150, partial [Planctomycetota bacterium]|nr:hypothetical protein [Planctomycetota bacterium]
LWSAAGGAEWCCDHPDVTIPLIVEHAGRSKDAERILADVKDAIRNDAGTEWAREADEAVLH